jgi:hypothetical protein
MLTAIRDTAHRFYMKHFYMGAQPGSYGRGWVGMGNVFKDMDELRMAMAEEIKSLRLAAGMNPNAHLFRNETTGKWIRDGGRT